MIRQKRGVGIKWYWNYDQKEYCSQMKCSGGHRKETEESERYSNWLKVSVWCDHFIYRHSRTVDVEVMRKRESERAYRDKHRSDCGSMCLCLCLYLSSKLVSILLTERRACWGWKDWLATTESLDEAERKRDRDNQVNCVCMCQQAKMTVTDDDDSYKVEHETDREEGARLDEQANKRKRESLPRGESLRYTSSTYKPYWLGGNLVSLCLLNQRKRSSTWL